MLNYEDMILPRLTRSCELGIQCNCNICLTARSHEKNKRISSDIIDENTGLVGSSDLAQLPSKEPEQKKRPSLRFAQSANKK